MCAICMLMSGHSDQSGSINILQSISPYLTLYHSCLHMLSSGYPSSTRSYDPPLNQFLPGHWFKVSLPLYTPM